MTRGFLKELGLEDEAINSIMAENGKDIEKEKAKFADYDDVKKQLDAANDRITSFGDVDAIKAEVEKYKADMKKMQADSEAKIKKMERESIVKDFTSSKKFVNDFTKASINSMLEAELEKEEAKGKSIEEIFNAITEGKENIFVPEEKKVTPPEVTKMTNAKETDTDADSIRAVMGLPVNK